MKRKNKNAGITLIALVITIIVLLILAGITLSTLAGRRGIIKQAQSAETEHNKGTAQEEIILVTMQSLDNKGNMDKAKLETGLNNIGAIIKSKGTKKWKVEHKGYGFEIDIEEGDVKEISQEELENTVDERLITKWNVTAGEEIGIIVYNEHYEINIDFTIDWGDGTVENINTGNITKKQYYGSSTYYGYITHTYQNTAEKTVIIEGVCEYFEPRNYDSIISVENWGETGLKRIHFSGCSNLTTIASPSKNSFTNITEYGFDYTFSNCTSLQYIPADLFKGCSNVTMFGCTFEGCSGLTSIPGTLFDDCINAVFPATFCYCSNLTGDPIELWGDNWVNTSEDRGGESCYNGCRKLNGYNDIPSHWTAARAN